MVLDWLCAQIQAFDWLTETRTNFGHVSQKRSFYCNPVEQILRALEYQKIVAHLKRFMYSCNFISGKVKNEFLNVNFCI